MAAGAVVLAGDNVGYRSVMSPQPDLLFTPNRPRQLADRLAYLLRQPAMRSEKMRWQDHYVQDFDVSVVGGQLVDRYKQALRQRQNVQ